MKVEARKIDDLIPAEYNPRQATKKQYEDLKASIEKFGIVDPVIVNKRNNHIVGGHLRCKVIKDMGTEMVPCVYVDLDDEAEKELNIRLNKNLGEWDWDLLANFETDFLIDVGFDEEELSKQFDLLTEAEEDEAPEVDETKTDSKLGEIYELGSHRLMCGDSTKKEDVEKLMNGKKADMVFTDPPYNVDYGSSKNPRHKIPDITNDNQSVGDWEKFNKDWVQNAIDFYKGGDFYCWGAPGFDGMRQRIVFENIGFHWSATIIYAKDRIVLTPANYQRQYEPCFYGWIKKSTWNGDRKQSELWNIKRPSDSKEHPTMKPLELCFRGIKNSSKQDDIVLDLFGGSGSTLIAAEQTNRICYMMEIDPKYCDVIRKRYDEFKGKNK